MRKLIRSNQSLNLGIKLIVLLMKNSLKSYPQNKLYGCIGLTVNTNILLVKCRLGITHADNKTTSR